MKDWEKWDGKQNGSVNLGTYENMKICQRNCVAAKPRHHNVKQRDIDNKNM